MSALLHLPVVLSFLLLAAHFMRAGLTPAMLIALLFPLLLFLRRRWVAWLAQGALLLGGLEWLRTLLVLASQRRLAGEPWGRMAFILGGVALFTLLSALAFRSESLRKRYSP